jgi:hypothetical protein
LCRAASSRRSSRKAGPGAQNATLQIPSNDPVTNPATVTLSGTGQ